MHKNREEEPKKGACVNEPCERWIINGDDGESSQLHTGDRHKQQTNSKQLRSGALEGSTKREIARCSGIH